MDKVRMVAADIDMTIEQVGHPFPELNRKAMEALHDKGVMFALASGRSVEQLIEKVDHWGLMFAPELLIGVNGSSIYDGINVVKDDLLTFKKEWIREILTFLNENDYTYHVYIQDYTLFNRKGKYFEQLYADSHRDVRISADPQDYVKDGFFKFLLSDENDIDELIRKFEPIQNRHLNDFKIIRTTKSSYEIVHAETSKAYGLKIFCKRHGIDLKDVIAFGDAQNDEEMLKAAGLGVCLKNGSESTKQIADMVTDLECNEGGFGDFVFKHLLKE